MPEFAEMNTPTIANQPGIQAGLSTQIVILCDGVAVGAVQRLTPTETRRLQRINEVGTDGWIEIVPINPTEVTVAVTRIVFDRLRLPEAFARGFQHIQAQRYSFDLLIFERFGWDPSGLIKHRTTHYENCWFTRYSSPYATDNYLITEEGEIWSERVYNDILNLPVDGRVGNRFYVDSVESDIDVGSKTGAMTENVSENPNK